MSLTKRNVRDFNNQKLSSNFFAVFQKLYTENFHFKGCNSLGVGFKLYNNLYG